MEEFLSGEGWKWLALVVFYIGLLYMKDPDIKILKDFDGKKQDT